jgi:hypothetical protein
MNLPFSLATRKKIFKTTMPEHRDDGGSEERACLPVIRDW